MITATLGGALVLQIQQMRNLKDPRDMTDPKFWGNAMLQSGALSIYGDLLYASENRFGGGLAGTVAGPTVGTAADVLNLTYGAATKKVFMSDEKTNYGREVSKFVRRYTPGASLWYVRPAWDRVLIDNLQRMLDPEAEAAFRRQKQNALKYKQKFWWKPGQTAPSRGPSLRAAVSLQ